MSATARDPLADIVRKLAACIRLLSSDKPFEVEGAKSGIQRLPTALTFTRSPIASKAAG